MRLFAAPFHLGEAAAALVGRCIATTAGAANNYSVGHDDDEDGQQASQQPIFCTHESEFKDDDGDTVRSIDQQRLPSSISGG